MRQHLRNWQRIWQMCGAKDKGTMEECVEHITPSGWFTQMYIRPICLQKLIAGLYPLTIDFQIVGKANRMRSNCFLHCNPICEAGGVAVKV
jgi:hypothetical protein